MQSSHFYTRGKGASSHYVADDFYIGLLCSIRHDPVLSNPFRSDIQADYCPICMLVHKSVDLRAVGLRTRHYSADISCRIEYCRSTTISDSDSRSRKTTADQSQSSKQRDVRPPTVDRPAHRLTNLAPCITKRPDVRLKFDV